MGQNEIKNIRLHSFTKYGYIIEYDHLGQSGFQKIAYETDAIGWRIGVLKVTAKNILQLSRHYNSMESFEPMEGVTLICLAELDNPEEYEIFLLDKAVCLYKNIWHNTLCLSESSMVKITENRDVDSDIYKLEREIRIGIV